MSRQLRNKRRHRHLHNIRKTRGQGKSLRIEQLEPRRVLATSLPNIIVINTDDQQFESIDFMPILQAQLAPFSATFTNSFVTTPICCPSRASLLTGLYAQNHGVLHLLEPLGGFENFNDTSTLATWLDAAGYNTAMVGKYLNGYDKTSVVNQDPNNTYVPPGWDAWRAFIGASFFNPTISIDGVSTSYPQAYSTDVLTNFAEDFILENNPQDDQPFFLYYAPFNPHEPAGVANRHVGFYDGIAPHRPPSFNEADVSDKPNWVKNKLPLLTATEIAAVDQFRQDQLESMLSVDEGIGRMLDALDQTGELQNTIIIFTSDNGQVWGEHRFVGKGPAWEESIRVPLLVYDGRNPTAQTIDEMALNIDLAPTIMELAGLPLPQPTDGESLVPLLNNEPVQWRDEFLIERYKGDGGKYFAIRTEQWTYTEYVETNGFELYDLVNDPYQLNSLHNDPAYASVRADLAARLAQLRTSDTAAPVTSNLAYTSGPAGVITVTATVSDATTGGAEVRNAEFFIDTIGNTGTGQTMRAVDGVYNSITENMEVDIAGLSTGQHTIFVHGRDVHGNWGPFVALEVNAEPSGSGDILYRINTGGPQLAGTPVWSQDTTASPSPFVNAATGNSRAATVTNTISLNHPSIPEGTPMEVFQSERFDLPGGGEMQWNFPVAPGEYLVRLYFAETWSGGQAAGVRVFDVQIEGATLLDNYDVFADVGGFAGVVKSFTVTSDSNLDIDFLHVTQNPSIKGIEIIDGAVPASSLAISTASLDFGSVVVNSSSSQMFTLTNEGPVGSPSITIDPAQATITPSDLPYNVAFEDTEPIVLGPGESTVVTVTYEPAAAGTHDATLSIVHSAVNSPLDVTLTGTSAGVIPINFGKSELADAPLHRPTKLQFGPDGRLYVTQQNGLIRIYTIVKDGPNDYRVTSQQQVTIIQNMPNHDDDGLLNTEVTNRLVTGMLVTGTAQNPVIYVNSSDPRIAGGTSHEDLHLDTNSGILSRLTWNGSSWVKLDLVRGLPRSEENHASNGIALDEVNNILYIAQGGNTNMGAPSLNFTLLPEYALSAAILSVDLDMIGNTTYDLPTLDDEDRAGTSDFNDPFGGNNGKNQAIIDPNGPVQVHSPGYRNPYDVHITTAGRMYTFDNGSNAGWGGMPVGEGPGGNATNQPNESNSLTIGDQLHYIPGPGYYGGHPNPTRSNPNNTFNASNPQSPVSLVGPNAVESDYRVPPDEDGSLYTIFASSNGLDEYTTDTFGGQMQGDLLVASFDNSVRRIKLDAAGDAVEFAETLFSNIDTVPLDVEAVDSGPWAGSIWVCDINTSTIWVFEPSAGGGGSPDDLDGDGYTNDDEQANGTNPNNAADVPPDWDMDFVSNLFDNNDDNDSLLDDADPYAIDADNGATTPVGTVYHWENEGEDEGGLLGLGFTGLMTNGVDDYEALFDPGALTAGGAAGVLTIDSATTGTARGASNTQEQAFQFGVDVSSETSLFTAGTSILGPFGALTPQAGQEMGLYIGTGDQDNYVQLVLSGDNGGSVQVMREVGGVFTSIASQNLALPGPGFVDLYLTVNPVTDTVQARYRVATGELVDLGGAISIPATWLAGSLAVGLIATDPTGTGVMPVTWDFLGVESGSPPSGVSEALVQIDPPTGGMLTASTAAAGSFRIVNNSTGNIRIQSVTINAATAILPDVVFDPDGAAGDTGNGPPFTADSGVIETGLTGHSFGGPHDGGFDSLTVNFDDFNPGETFTFHVDVDPTSIQGAVPPGPSSSGSISGLELNGATVTVVFSNGDTTHTQTFRTAGSQKASQSIAHNVVPAAPGLQLVGTTTPPAVVTNANQTLRVTGPVGATARLIRLEASLHLAGVPGGGFDIDPFEANKAIALTEYVVTIGAGGFVDVPVVLTNSEPEGGLNYFVAAIQDSNGRTGSLSPKVVLKLQTAGPSLSIAAASANQDEGNTGTTAFTFTVTRSGDTSGTTTVNYAVAGSGVSPADAADFGGSLPSGIVTFTAGQTSQPITVNVSGDTGFEPNETFSVTLSSPSGGAQITTASATGTIVNDDVQDGLVGQYFNAVDLTGLASTRVDATVNFPQDWGSAPAGTAVTADDKFSVRWTGFVETSTTGSWTFFTTSNDGVRLWIDDVLVIDNWTTHAVTENSATLSLTAGWHSIRLEYFQQNGIAEITLSFQGPGQSKAIISQDKLRTTNPGSGLLAVAALEGDYDNSGAVDHDDYGVWRQSFGTAGTNLPADGNGDGIVDAADYAVWRFNRGRSFDDFAFDGSSAFLVEPLPAAVAAESPHSAPTIAASSSAFASALLPGLSNPGSTIMPRHFQPPSSLPLFDESQLDELNLLGATAELRRHTARDAAFTVSAFHRDTIDRVESETGDEALALVFESFGDGMGQLDL